MSIQGTLNYLKTRLETMNPPLNVVKNAPTESVSDAEFPMAMIMLAPQIMNGWRMEGSGYVRHTYYISIHIFAGFRNSGVTELHNRTFAEFCLNGFDGVINRHAVFLFFFGCLFCESCHMS